jgi:hypothetical protein
VGHRVLRAMAVGLGAGVLLALAATVIGRPSRRPHLPVDCIFSSRAWKHEAGILWHTRGYRESSARGRMRADLVAHHLTPGTPEEAVLEMLGPPDSVDPSTGHWVYMTAYSSGVTVSFSRRLSPRRRAVVSGTGWVSFEYTWDWNPVFPGSRQQRVQHGFAVDGRLTMQ